MNSPFCYDFIDRCNGLVRCPDLSDELNCPGKNDTDLPKLEKLCRGDSLYFCPKGGRIICSQEKCDGIKQCIFGEDEEDCLDTKPRGIVVLNKKYFLYLHLLFYLFIYFLLYD